MILTGFPGDPPLKTTVTYIDVSTGLFATIGVLLALHHREKTGQGQLIDVSLFDTAVFATQALGALLLYELYGDIRRQVGNCGFHSYVGCFEVSDGWVIVGPATNTIWKRFARAIGRGDMAGDARFLNDMDRFKNAPLIDLVVKEWGRSKTVAEVTALLQEARVPCSVVNTVRELPDDVQVRAREAIRYVDYPGLGKIPVPGIPIKLSLTPGKIDTPAPALGEHNEEVYSKLLGISLEKIGNLKRKGII
jgi:CoA:oxalate CoA-transferase